ncbi:hypothetical protein ACHAW6_014794 [Cyclotella cf. meneghiniana]
MTFHKRHRGNMLCWISCLLSNRTTVQAVFLSFCSGMTNMYAFTISSQRQNITVY